MECKVFQSITLCHTQTVLIETLWNVKTVKIDAGIYSVTVLIETLWNVKFLPLIIIFHDRKVLIETLWNVKTRTSGTFYDSHTY